MQKYKLIQKHILHYYKINKRDLPWREKSGELQNPYCTLISEIMLQQTKVETVKVYYIKFLKKWPTLYSLSRAKLSEVLTYWSGLGYYRRAINLHKTAKLIEKNYQGKVPNDFESLKKLPGIGDYTAAAILGFAYGQYSIIIDTNIKKFLFRIFGINKDQFTNKKKIYSIAKILFPKKKSGDFAQAIMDFSSDICTNRKPKCDICKIKKYCAYIENEEVINNKKKEKKILYNTSYFFICKNYFLLRKKPLKSLLGGLYEVPCSDWTEKKIYNYSYSPSTNKFHKYEKLVAENTVKHEFTHLILYSTVIIFKVLSDKRFININKKEKWFTVKDLQNNPVSSLTKKIVSYSFKILPDLK